MRNGEKKIESIAERASQRSTFKCEYVVLIFFLYFTSYSPRSTHGWHSRTLDALRNTIISHLSWVRLSRDEVFRCWHVRREVREREKERIRFGHKNLISFFLLFPWWCCRVDILLFAWINAERAAAENLKEVKRNRFICNFFTLLSLLLFLLLLATNLLGCEDYHCVYHEIR